MSERQPGGRQPEEGRKDGGGAGKWGRGGLFFFFFFFFKARPSDHRVTTWPERVHSTVKPNVHLTGILGVFFGREFRIFFSFFFFVSGVPGRCLRNASGDKITFKKGELCPKSPSHSLHRTLCRGYIVL